MREGYELKRAHESHRFRLVAYIGLLTGWSGKSKPPSIREFWSIPLIDDGGTNEEEEVERIKKVLKRYKEGKLYTRNKAS